MPLSGGTSGAHDDAMHQGNAKRDVVGGLAGVDSSGDVLSRGPGLKLVRDGSNDVVVVERTSNEQVLAMRRIGAADYLFRVFDGGAAHEVQNASMKDAVSGIAALDAAGSLLLPGSKMYYTRDGSDDVHIYERTSNEEAYAFHRVGADDYTFFVKESNVWKRMQTESMKDAANGIAGLDGNVQLDVLQMRSCLEEYSNHNGVIDNYMTSAVATTGTVSTDAANHELDISTGTPSGGQMGYAFVGSKRAYSITAKPLVCNILVQNIVNGAGGSRTSDFGFDNDFTSFSLYNSSFFRHMENGTWRVYSGNAGTFEYTDISAISNGDLLTVVLVTGSVRFFVNGVLVATHTQYIPAVAVEFGAFVLGVSPGDVTTARSVSIDYLKFVRYV